MSMTHGFFSDLPASDRRCDSRSDPLGRKPERVTISPDRVFAFVEDGKAVQTIPYDQAVDSICGDFATNLKVREQLPRLPGSMGRVGSLVAMVAGVPVDTQAAVLPPHSEQVPAVGQIVATVVRTDPEAAAVLKVHLPTLEEALARDAFLGELHAEISWLAEIVGNARSHTLRTISDTVVNAMQKGRPEMEKNARLMSKLQVPWKLVFSPAERAQETRRNNLQVAARAVAAERAKHPAPPAAPVPQAPPTAGEPTKKLP